MTSFDNRKCYTFTWAVENISYCWQKTGEHIQSPEFVISVLEESKWYVDLHPRGLTNDNEIDVFLRRRGNGKLTKIDCELAFLSTDGSVLASQKEEKCDYTCVGNLSERKKVFMDGKSPYQDKVTVRCRIWKSAGEMTENGHCFARTRISIERYSFLWRIPNLNNLQPEEHNFQIKSVLNNEVLMNIDLSMPNSSAEDDSINIQLAAAETDVIKYFVLNLAPLKGTENANKGFKNEFLFYETNKFQLLTLPFTKTELTGNKNHPYLKDGGLSFRCECSFSTGVVFEQIERVIHGCNISEVINPDNQRLDEKNTKSVSKRILNENLKSLLDDSILSDVTLKTGNASFLCHKNILSARSPVFKKMFSSDMKEKLTDCVHIEDLDSGTVSRMLRYIYTAEIEDLRQENICELYGAADKYEILALRDECSAYLKANFCSSNACDVLVLADSYQDEALKSSVQDFIFKHDIMNSEEWKHFMGSHLKLAAETMHLQIQRMSLRTPLKM